MLTQPPKTDRNKLRNCHRSPNSVIGNQKCNTTHSQPWLKNRGLPIFALL